MLKWFNKKRNKKGFTLIEMVIVIAILGILIAIAVPRLAGFRDSAQVAADEATAETIEKAANLYVANEGKPGFDVLSNALGDDDDNFEEFAKILEAAELLDLDIDSKDADWSKFKVDKNEHDFTVKVGDE